MKVHRIDEEIRALVLTRCKQIEEALTRLEALLIGKFVETYNEPGRKEVVGIKYNSEGLQIAVGQKEKPRYFTINELWFL